MSLPPNVSATAFNAALAEWRKVVGPEWVFTSDEDVALYRDAYSPFYGEPEERVASAAVAPASLEQVQAVVRAANQHRVPLYPISTGRNLAYGGSAPVYSGSVVLDLKRMNRVLEVNERNAYALVEPGVSYFDLYKHITDAKLDVWIDPPDPGWGSVIGNALDGGGGWTASPFRDHFGSHCGMEVVLANGEVVRTGMGALPNSKSWQHARWGFGPWVDGLFRQSNFGVVTKMGFYLMPRPEAMWTGTVTAARNEDIVPLLDVLNRLENEHIVNGSTQISGGPDRPGSNAPTWSCAGADLWARSGRARPDGVRQSPLHGRSGSEFRRGRAVPHALVTGCARASAAGQLRHPEPVDVRDAGAQPREPGAPRWTHRVFTDRAAHRRGVAGVQALLQRQPAQGQRR
ncbi:MAG: FAD-dependent oxidoreductase [Gammaproteobacteria bacterium]